MNEEFDKEVKKCKAFLEEKGFVINEENLQAVLSAKQLGYPILLVGPTGCGKTHLLSLLAEYWGGKYDYQSLNGNVTIHDLTQTRDLDEKGKFIPVDMCLAKWLRHAQKGISIMHFDEVNAAKPQTLLSLHPIMDIKGELCLPYTDECLPVNKNAILVMSANEGDEYAGINAMNAAFQNRFIKVHMPYLQGDVLADHLAQKTDVPKDQTKMVVNTWTKYMESRQPDQVVISIRVLERWCELSKLIGLKKAGITCFANLIARDEDERAELVEGDFFVNLPTR